ncbi:uncharacterized protein PRCAT00003544001 [Priceomyces carsonii]|uniref:uncharacterized protein n=1 Tax=Priceomyces carsonii TaxID=28549 RepID=UPI002ED96A7A|nr:unnamed protein product [Priceomyces carsonii]
MLVTKLIVFSIFFRFLSGASLETIYKREIKKPSLDPFYVPPKGYEKYKNGHILKHRVVEDFGFFKIPVKAKEAHQYLVRSEDSMGNPNAIVTSLFVPYDADPSMLVSYHIAQDSSDADCAISYGLQLNTTWETWVMPQLEEAVFQTFLYEGYYVVVPDHEGPKASFGVGRQSGHAALDSIRAVLSTGNTTKIDSKARVAMWGYSGGSHPGTWGTYLHSTYAPEINLVGAAMGGVIVNLYDILKVNIDTPTAGLVMAGLSGLANEYSAVKKLLKENFKSNKLGDEFFEVNKKCLIPYIFKYAFKNIDDYIKLAWEVINSPAAKPYADAQNILLQNGTTKVPIYLYNAVGDQIIPVNDTNKFYERLCSGGATVEYRESLFGGHITEWALGSGSALEWVKDRLKGVHMTQGCKKYQVESNALTETGISGLSEIFGNILSSALGEETGPK